MVIVNAVHMCFQRTQLSSSIITLGTLEWSMVIVNAVHMCFQSTQLTSSIITLSTLEWSIMFMNAIYMSIQVTWVTGSIITFRTLELSMTFVNAIYMSIQVTWVNGSIITFRTLEWLRRLHVTAMTWICSYIYTLQRSGSFTHLKIQGRTSNTIYRTSSYLKTFWENKLTKVKIFPDVRFYSHISISQFMQ